MARTLTLWSFGLFVGLACGEDDSGDSTSSTATSSTAPGTSGTSSATGASTEGGSTGTSTSSGTGSSGGQPACPCQVGDDPCPTSPPDEQDCGGTVGATCCDFGERYECGQCGNFCVWTSACNG